MRRGGGVWGAVGALAAKVIVSTPDGFGGAALSTGGGGGRAGPGPGPGQGGEGPARGRTFS